MNSIVKVFEKERKPHTQTNREEEGGKDCACTVRSHREIRRDSVVDDGNVVWLAGHHHIVLFGALEQIIKQRLICFDLLLDDAVVDGCFVLREGLRALLLKSLAQRLLALERLPVAGIQI